MRIGTGRAAGSLKHGESEKRTGVGRWILGWFMRAKREREQGRNWEVGIRREVGEGEEVTQTIKYGLG